MLHQPAGRLVPSAILGSTGFVNFFNSAPFVCGHVFFVVNNLREILFWGCTAPCAQQLCSVLGLWVLLEGGETLGVPCEGTAGWVVVLSWFPGN